MFSGIIMVEATKQVYAAPRVSAQHRRRAVYAPRPQVALPPAGAAGAVRDISGQHKLGQDWSRGSATPSPLSCAPKIEHHGDRI